MGLAVQDQTRGHLLREFLRRKVRGQRSRPVAAVLWRLLVAALLTASVIGLATLGLFMSTAPEFVSLVLEPLSLLLMPGLILSAITAGAHDLDPTTIVVGSIGFYLVLFYGLLHFRLRRRHHRFVAGGL